MNEETLNQPITWKTSGSFWNFINNNPILIVIFFILIIVYFSIWGNIWFFLVLLIVFFIIVQLLYFFGIKIWTTLSTNNTNTSQQKIDIHIDTNQSTSQPVVPEITLQKQVFNAGRSDMTYSNANALCKAFGGDLATYSQIENYYNKGGEFSQYGWSDGQMILFPTQQSTFDKLQTIQGHEHDRGRPGVNGGYIDNPNMLFSANCYGYKPKMTVKEQIIMENEPLYPKTTDEIKTDKQVQYWKNNLQNVLVAPFNSNTWSKL